MVEDCGGREGPRATSGSGCGCGGRAGMDVGRVNSGREGECGIVTFAVGSDCGGGIPASEVPFSGVSYALRLFGG